MMQDNKMLKVTLTPMSRQTIATTLTNFVSSISDNEEVEMSFSLNENEGTSHIHFESVKKSKTPNIQKSLELTDKNLDVKIGSSKTKKVENKADKG